MPFFLQLFFVLRDPVNSQIVAYTAMDVIGIVFSDYAQDTPSGFKIPVHKTKTFYFITHILQKQKLITLVRRQ